MDTLKRNTGWIEAYWDIVELHREIWQILRRTGCGISNGNAGGAGLVVAAGGDSLLV